jgi:pimeloyl-ACP methyl ester carboxylesterase
MAAMPMPIRARQPGQRPAWLRDRLPPPRVARMPAAVPAVPVLAAAVLAAAVLAAGCTGQRPAPPPASPAAGTAAGTAARSTVRWHPCQVTGAQMQCARLRVPLDYARPGGRKITLALSRVPATAAPGQRLGDLLVNPGGPGASGLSLAASVAAGLDPAVAARYDIIGFDPRGVGASVPALHCDPSFFHGVRPDYIPATRADERVLENRARRYAAGCQHRFGWLLPYLTTVNAVRDMDAIRAALGQRQISYFGMSYGTYLGEVYATLFPHRVRRMVLDSVINPEGVWYQDNIAQDYAFQRRLEAFFSWAAAHDGTYHLGSTRAAVQAAWYRARTRLESHPVTGPSGPLIGPDEFDDTYLAGGYEDTAWPGLAGALSAYLRSGSVQPLIAQYRENGTQSENLFAVYNAVECADVNWPRSWARWDADTRRVYRSAPFQAWDNAWFNAACAFWPVRGPARPLRIGHAGLPGILMLQGTLDAATPYQGALVARRLLPSARLVAVQGGGNHVQFFSPTPCLTGYLNHYLASGALPPGRGLVAAVCPAPPPPAP